MPVRLRACSAARMPATAACDAPCEPTCTAAKLGPGRLVVFWNAQKRPDFAATSASSVPG